MPARRLVLALALAGSACAAAAELGTLFHSAEERARLDRLRRGEAPRIAGPAARANPELTGYVQRSDGRNTVWIDGVPVPVSSPRAAPLFDPRAVRDQGELGNGVTIERREAVKR